MMNSAADDDFPPNPFRTGGDPFAPQPTQQQPQMQMQPQMGQPQMQMGQPQMQQQPQFSQPPPPAQQFGGQQPAYNNNMGGAMDSTTPHSTPTSWWGLCLAGMRLETYKRYFNVDTDDIRTRMTAAMTHFHQPQYFRDQVVGPENPQLGIQASAPSELKGPDLYGPVWITFVLILLVAVS